MSGYAPRPSTTIGLYTIRPCVRPPHGPPQMATPLGPAELHDWHRPNHDHVFTRESTQNTTKISFVTSAAGTYPAQKAIRTDELAAWPLDVRADANRSEIDRKRTQRRDLAPPAKKSPPGCERTVFRGGFTLFSLCDHAQRPKITRVSRSRSPANITKSVTRVFF